MRLDRLGDDDFARALAGAASSDGPDVGTKERAWARFAAAEALIHRSGPPGAPGEAAVESLLRRSAHAAGWLAAGTLVGILATVAVGGGRSAPASLGTAPRVWSGGAAASAPVAVDPAAPAPDRLDAPAAPTRAPAPSRMAPARGHHAMQAEDRASLAAEIAALDAARSALRNGTPDEALARLQRYRRDFPQGKLAPEAAVTALEALAAKGDHDGVASGAAKFFARYPDAPQRDRVERLVAVGANSK